MRPLLYDIIADVDHTDPASALVTLKCGCVYYHNGFQEDDGYRGYRERRHAWWWYANHAGPIQAQMLEAQRKEREAFDGITSDNRVKQ